MTRIVPVILLACCALLAQSQRASISGEVTDALGAAMVGARVTATNTETNVAATAVTNSSGIYLIANLDIGAYSVTVEHTGFRRYQETGIVMRTAAAKPDSLYPGSVRTQRFNLVNGTELYDVQADPGETEDISSKNPTETERLRHAYEEWFASTMQPYGLQRYPIPVGYDQENPVMLTVPESLLRGKLRFWQGNGWAHDWITNWVSENDEARWDIDVVQSGRYRVSALYLCPAEGVGARVTVQAGTARAGKAIIEATPMTPLPNRDLLPRKETPEMQWSELALGEFDLAKGRASLDLRAAPNAGIEMKAVILKRVQN